MGENGHGRIGIIKFNQFKNYVKIIIIIIIKEDKVLIYLKKKMII
jgi:hypothetical protein